jgi:hypothetical protein
MAKTAAKRPAAASKTAAPKKSGGSGLRPAFLAAGLGLFWFVEYQDAGGGDGGGTLMWNYLAVLGVRLLADFVGAWVLISAAQLVFALGRYGITYLRSMWMQQESS